MNDYKNVRTALRDFVLAQMPSRFNGSQVFRQRPKPTEITRYPAFVIMANTLDKLPLNGDGPTLNVYNLRFIIVCREPTSEGAADLLDDLLQEFDSAVSAQGVLGLNAALATNGSKWHNMTRLNQPTEFDYPIEDQLNWVVTSVTAGIQIVEKTTQLRG